MTEPRGTGQGGPQAARGPLQRPHTSPIDVVGRGWLPGTPSSREPLCGAMDEGGRVGEPSGNMASVRVSLGRT